MQLNADEWTLVLADPATNYHARDHAVASVDIADGKVQPILLVDAIHVELGVSVRLTLRVPVLMVPALAAEFDALETDLRQQGAIT